MTDGDNAVCVKRIANGELRLFYRGEILPGVTCIDVHSKCGCDHSTVTATFLSQFVRFETD